jgi:hypothetical protein
MNQDSLYIKNLLHITKVPVSYPNGNKTNSDVALAHLNKLLCSLLCCTTSDLKPYTFSPELDPAKYRNVPTRGFMYKGVILTWGQFSGKMYIRFGLLRLNKRQCDFSYLESDNDYYSLTDFLKNFQSALEFLKNGTILNFDKD